ncbi:MAG: GntR family transcriptional regulator [Clostridiales bacterium]|nr:GntR family transcriptional regulator [Clostridiales bacterium]
MANNEKKYRQVYDYLMQYIADNHLQSDDKLPTENELSGHLKLSRTTIRRALQELVDDNIAYRVQGGGTYLSAKQCAKPNLSFIPLVIGNQDKETGFYDYISGAESFLSHHSCYLTVHCSHSDIKLEEQIIQRLIDDGIRCMMIRAVSSHSADFFLHHIRNGIRFVFLDCLPYAVDSDLVTSDNITGGMNACEYLIRLGHQRIFFTDGQENDITTTNTVRDRYTGYLHAMAKHGLQQFSRHISCPGESEQVQKILSELFQTPESPTALFAVNDMHASSIVSALKEIGLRVPEDVSVIGFDGTAIASAFSPKITTVEQQFFNIGYHAAELAYQQSQEQSINSYSFTHKYLPTGMLIGESTKQLLAK